MIKKLLFIAAVAVCAASCLGDETTYTNSYTLKADFENLSLTSTDSLFFDSTSGIGLAWNELGFYHKLNEEKTEHLGGFILSKLKTKGDVEADGFRANSSTGLKNSSHYLVYIANPDESKMPDKDMEFLAKAYGTCGMIGCYVNNTREVVNAVKKTFVDGDRLAIKLTGYAGEKKTATLEYVLAEYTEQKDSLVTTWSPFELEKLGNIEYIDIEIVTNRDDIPKAFCMDDIYAKIDVEF